MSSACLLIADHDDVSTSGVATCHNYPSAYVHLHLRHAVTSIACCDICWTASCWSAFFVQQTCFFLTKSPAWWLKADVLSCMIWLLNVQLDKTCTVSAQNKGTGQLSSATYIANFLGCIARTFTSYKEGGGISMIRAYVLGGLRCCIASTMPVRYHKNVKPGLWYASCA